MTRAKGTRKPCDVQQARQRLTDARQFLEAAKLLDAPDVVATCAIHAAIAASDAITCHALGERSNDGNHGSAVDVEPAAPAPGEALALLAPFQPGWPKHGRLTSTTLRALWRWTGLQHEHTGRSLSTATVIRSRDSHSPTPNVFTVGKPTNSARMRVSSISSRGSSGQATLNTVGFTEPLYGSRGPTAPPSSHTHIRSVNTARTPSHCAVATYLNPSRNSH